MQLYGDFEGFPENNSAWFGLVSYNDQETALRGDEIGKMELPFRMVPFSRGIRQFSGRGVYLPPRNLSVFLEFRDYDIKSPLMSLKSKGTSPNAPLHQEKKGLLRDNAWMSQEVSKWLVNGL